MSALHQKLHDLATLCDLKLTDPKPVAEAFARHARWAELRAEPTVPTLDVVLADTPVKSWERAITDHATATARQSAIRASGTHTFDRVVDRTVRDNIDDYLAVIAPAVRDAAERMTTNAASMTTLDSNESVLRNEGHYLHAYTTAHALIGAYAALCAQINRGHKSHETGGMNVFGELAVIHPGTIPVEIRDRDTVGKKTINPAAERAHIDAARRALRAPRTSITELISDVAFGRTHEAFSLAIPATAQAIDDTLRAWDAANRVAWAT